MARLRNSFGFRARERIELVDLDAGAFDHVGPLLDAPLQHSGDVFGRADLWPDAGRPQLLLHGFVVEGAFDFAMEPIDDVRGCAGRCKNPVGGGSIEVADAGLRDRWNVGKIAGTCIAGDGNRSELTLPHILQHGRYRGDPERDPACYEIGHGLSGAPIGDMYGFDSR